MRHGQIVEVLDPAKHMAFHPGRLLPEDGECTFSVRRENERVEFGGSQLVQNRDAEFEYSAFLGARNDTGNGVAEEKGNITCLFDFVLPDSISVRELRGSER